MNNIDVSIGTVMLVVINSYEPVVVRHAVAPVGVKRSFKAVVAHRPANATQTRVARRPVRTCGRRRAQVVRVARTPRQPRPRRVASTRPSPARNADPPPGPSRGTHVGGAS